MATTHTLFLTALPEGKVDVVIYENKKNGLPRACGQRIMIATWADVLQAIQPAETCRVKVRFVEDLEADDVVDFRLQDEGTIAILYPETEAAVAWCDQHLPNDAQRWGGNGYVIEHRFVGDILFGIHNDGLEVR
jgi:hypothetical protein